jgi:hypothetical protein
MGVYDSVRKMVYYTESDRVDVFSTGSRTWQSPIVIPAGVHPRGMRLAATSPQGAYLAVTDAANESVIVIDLSTRTYLREVSLRSINQYLGGNEEYPLVFDSETKLYTLAQGELHLTNISNGNLIWYKQVFQLPDIAFNSKMVLDSTGRYLLFNSGLYYDLQESGSIDLQRWGCMGNAYSEFQMSVDGKVSQADCFLNSDLEVTSQTYYSDAQYWTLDPRYGQVWDKSALMCSIRRAEPCASALLRRSRSRTRPPPVFSTRITGSFI